MTCRVCGTELPDGALFCGECGSAVGAQPAVRDEIADRREADTSIVRPARSTEVPHRGLVAPERPPESAGRDTSFVLVFPSGRREPVRGGGLLGRRPVAQPTETFEQYVVVDDPGRTVSKTHLQFGVEGGEFWVCDRYSANGTVVVSPSGSSRPCEPGRRYRAPRGSRVEIGESHFDVE